MQSELVLKLFLVSQSKPRSCRVVLIHKKSVTISMVLPMCYLLKKVHNLKGLKRITFHGMGKCTQ